MIDLTSAVQIVLEEAGYDVWLANIERTTTICFEDEAVVGFVRTFETPQQILNDWEKSEHAFLQRYAARLKVAGEKAWNAYSVLLATGEATDTEVRQLRQIEENLERTRKIANCGLFSKDDVTLALLPLLPIQHQPVLELPDLTERIRRRLQDVSPAIGQSVLNDQVSVSEIVSLLGET